MIRKKITVTGIVQGVGFRPFLHRITKEFGCTGWIRNTSSGVECELQGKEEDLNKLLMKWKTEAPPLAVLEHISEETIEPVPEEGFRIRASEKGEENDVLISPDIATCPDCLAELASPKDRRYRYPFINCTNCGPRFTIVRDVPYDRARTSMAQFPMCDECRAEYDNIENRRYHAQPDCCSVCGPELFYVKADEVHKLQDNNAAQQEKCQEKESTPQELIQSRGKALTHMIQGNEKALRAAKELLLSDGILAVKGLGGMHLACRVTEDLVAELRRRKHREEKPFAVMCRDLETAKKLVLLEEEEEKLLTGARRPIVLAKKNPAFSREALDAVSDNAYVGVMLPYTPIQALLMEEDELSVLIMTSANRSDCPIMYRNEEALEELKGIADGFLLHNRDIVTRCDDSLYRILEGRPYPLRRSRGYAPQPVSVSACRDGILACGAEQKASFALTKGNYVFPSQHIGDLKNWETCTNYEEQIRHFEKLFGIRVKSLVCDLHPDYLSTEYARERAQEEELPLLQVQHHHAHFASCMADNRLEGQVIGLVWDGTGLGSDGTIWGGEAFYGGYEKAERLGSIRPMKLPGGDLAVKEIDRIALSLLMDAGCVESERNSITLLSNIDYAVPEVNNITYAADTGYVHPEGNTSSNMTAEKRSQRIQEQLRKNVNCPLSSGMGRLFDGVCAILGIRQQASYEGQGAVLLEAAAEKAGNDTFRYPSLCWEDTGGVFRWDYRPMIAFLAEERRKGVPAPVLAASFHHALADMALQQCRRMREMTGEKRVVLSGGVFQNMILTKRLLSLLREDGFEPYRHERVAANDEGICLGQVMIAARR